MRGVKQIEYRSAPTKIRGRIYVYASLGRYAGEDEVEMMEKYGIDDATCDELPRGVLIGTVELYDCDGGEWMLREPQRESVLRKPEKHPQPIWFNPF
jgi:hypothetical protein